MMSAFSRQGAYVFSVYKSHGLFNKLLNNGCLLYSHQSRIGHYVYLIYASLVTLYISRKKRIDTIYTRSIVIGSFCSFVTHRLVVVELHSSFSNAIEKYLARLGVMMGMRLVCITENLSRYIEKRVPKANCFIAADAHSAEIRDHAKLTGYYNKWQDGYCPKVGYFGLLNLQKGKEVIKGLV